MIIQNTQSYRAMSYRTLKRYNLNFYIGNYVLVPGDTISEQKEGGEKIIQNTHPYRAMSYRILKRYKLNYQIGNDILVSGGEMIIQNTQSYGLL